MAVVSSHTLNAVDGTHAGGIAVALYKLGVDDTRTEVFRTEMDEGGRLSETVLDPDGTATYELVFRIAAYFAARKQQSGTQQILDEVVIRFSMPDPDGRYHIPLILAPNNYSVWWSS